MPPFIYTRLIKESLLTSTYVRREGVQVAKLILTLYQLGQAIRIAQFEGLHTQLPEEQLGLEVVTRCRNLWWTLYIMDRHFSYSVGLPMTTTDSDISASINPPDTCLTEDVAFTLQAKLSRLMSFILTCTFPPIFFRSNQVVLIGLLHSCIQI